MCRKRHEKLTVILIFTMNIQTFVKLSDVTDQIDDFDIEEYNDIVILPPETVDEVSDIEENIHDFHYNCNNLNIFECAGQVEIFKPDFSNNKSKIVSKNIIWKKNISKKIYAKHEKIKMNDVYKGLTF